MSMRYKRNDKKVPSLHVMEDIKSSKTKLEKKSPNILKFTKAHKKNIIFKFKKKNNRKI